MTRRRDLSQITALSKMLLDNDLQHLQKAATRRNAIAARLTGLAPAEAPGLNPVTEARLRDRYQVWADGKRMEINLALARAQAEWLEQRDKATQSLARHDVLRKLSEK
ncbi:MAG: hypothetical protein ACK5M4_09485 [Pseudorhodobacter sp.]